MVLGGQGADMIFDGMDEDVPRLVVSGFDDEVVHGGSGGAKVGRAGGKRDWSPSALIVDDGVHKRVVVVCQLEAEGRRCEGGKTSLKIEV